MTTTPIRTEQHLAELAPPTKGPQAYYWDADHKDALKGFGVVVGATGTRTFVARAWVRGEKMRRKIGIAGRPREDGALWTVALARVEAKKFLGKMADGIDPTGARRASTGSSSNAGGPTLRDALDAHLARMRKKQRAERSITTLESEVTKYLAEHLDRPIAELTGAVLVDLHERIKRQARARAGSNPANEKGAPLANRVITSVGACWNSLNRKLEGALGTWNPAKAVDRDVLKPKRERLADDELPAWWAKVQTLSPVRRDLATFCLFSSMRSEAARHVRFEHANLTARTVRRGDVELPAYSLLVPSPKGGEARAFTLPLGPTLVELIKRRQRENVVAFAPHGGDGGWVFPSLSRARDPELADADNPRGRFVVQPVQEAKERRVNPTTGEREKFLSGPHTSRRTYLSVAAEAGVSEIDRHVLANHSFAKRNVAESYVSQGWSHLLGCQRTVDRALHARLKPKRRT